jgi:hypothetical protein
MVATVVVIRKLLNPLSEVHTFLSERILFSAEMFGVPEPDFRTTLDAAIWHSQWLLTLIQTRSSRSRFRVTRPETSREYMV